MAGVNERTVIRALRDLGVDRNPVSAASVASYLKIDEPLALSLLRSLKKQRIVKDVRRKGERLWTGWSS